MERLLKGDEQDGWSEFCDPLWLSLFQRVLSAGQLGSQVILTTQDVPGELEGVGDRFNQLWHCQPLQGLSSQEQVELFEKLGLVDEGDRLQKIGQFYDGHPLVLQVIADEIKQRPFNGNIQAYWERYGEEFEAVTPKGKVDRSRVFRTRVRHRVEQTIDSLPESAKQLLSACSVFHRPVPETFWIEMGDGDDPYVAFDLLKGRNLVEYVDVPGQASLVRLHNLIRSVAYGLLRGDLGVWEKAERKAADLWLTAYVAPDDAPNIETVRGYLEAFDHFCEVRDWEQTCSVLDIQIDSPTQEPLHWQLETWGYYQEQIQLYKKVIGKTSIERDILWFRGFGIAYTSTGDYTLAIQFHQQSLELSRSIGDKSSEGKALGNLGLAYRNLGQYQQAIDFHQQHLAIAREIGDSRGEGQALGSLGIAYHNLGQYQKAIEFQQQSLAITRAIGDRLGEGIALVNMGDTQRKLHQYPESLTNTQAALQIFRDIGSREGEAEALLNLAKLHRDTNDTTQALHFCHQALAIASDLGIPLKDDCETLLRELTGEV